MLTPEIGGAHFVVGSLLILAQEGAGKPNGNGRGGKLAPCLRWANNTSHGLTLIPGSMRSSVRLRNMKWW